MDQVARTDGGPPDVRREVVLNYQATRARLFKAFQALADLADKSEGGKIFVRNLARSSAASGCDAPWLRNAVQEPLGEADMGMQHADS
jgi:hypothetical protein